MSEENITLFPGTPLLPGIIDDTSTLGTELLEPEDSQRARYSGKIVDKNAERVRAILGARAMGYPIRQICQTYSVSAHTVAEIERRHAVKLATLKERLARKFGVFVEMGIDRAISEVGRMDIDKLMVSLGIAADKLQVLTGEASIIIGTPAIEGNRFSVEGLRARLSRQVIDVTPSPTGLEPRKDEPTRDPGALEAST